MRESREATKVRCIVLGSETLCGFNGSASENLSSSVKKYQWANWERRINPDTGKEKWFLVVKNPDSRDGGEPSGYGPRLTRIQTIVNVFLDEGLSIEFRSEKEADYSKEYEEYVWKNSKAVKDGPKFRVSISFEGSMESSIRARATELGLPVATYIRHLVAEDIAKSRRKNE